MLSFPVGAADVSGGRPLMTMQQATQRMPPVQATRLRMARLAHVVLPELVREKERHDQQRQHEERTQNYSLDHDESPAPMQGVSSEREIYSKRMSLSSCDRTGVLVGPPRQAAAPQRADRYLASFLSCS